MKRAGPWPRARLLAGGARAGRRHDVGAQHGHGARATGCADAPASARDDDADERRNTASAPIASQATRAG